MKAALFCPLGSVAVALTLASAASAASVGDGWRWPRPDLRKSVRVHIVVDAGFDRSLLPELKDAAKAWQATGDLAFDFPPKPVKSCDPIVRDTICVAAPASGEGPCPTMGGCSWQTELVAGGDHGASAGSPTGQPPSTLRLISYARVWITLRNAQWDVSTDAGWVTHVLCHELGHDIGLGHTEDTPKPWQPSCMSNDYSAYSEGPSADDLAFVHQLYSTVTT